MPLDTSNMKVMGYRRENGRVGVRNHVVILPVDDISNAACEAVANNIKGTMALPHAYGRLQFGEDLDLHFRTMIGTGSNPNVAAVVVIGIEPGWTKKIVDGIAETGKPVVGFSIEQNGDIKTIADASWKAKEYVHWASELQREECDISELWISTKCGESDTTNNEARDKFLNTFEAYSNDVIFAHQTDDLSDSQPTKGNIEGGLTTIEEKALGNLEKIGKKVSYIDALEPAEAPAKGKGLYFMDTSSAAAECITLMAAAGYVVHTFPTGQGNVVGNPIVPVIKITANPRTVRTMGEHVDLDVSGILTREQTIPEAGDALIEMVRRTSNGRATASEALGHKEFVMTKLYRSA